MLAHCEGPSDIAEVCFDILDIPPITSFVSTNHDDSTPVHEMKIRDSHENHKG